MIGSHRDRIGALDPAQAEARAILLFACAEFLDVGTTLLGLRSGRFREGNPLAGTGLAGTALAGTNFLLALKLLVVVAILLLVQRFISPGRRARVLIVLATIAMAAPALNAAHLLAAR